MATLIEPTRLGDVLKYEPENRHGREVVTIKSGADLAIGTVLGKISVGALTAVGAAGVPAPAAATITASPTAVGAKVGVHRFVCVIGGSTTASKWEHEDPDGETVGVATGDTAYSGGGLGLTITDAGADPVAGVAFTVTVTAAAGSGKYAALTPAAVDGSQHAAAVLLTTAAAASADVADMLALVRGPAGLAEDHVVWPAGISAGDKATAIAELETKSIIIRNEA